MNKYNLDKPLLFLFYDQHIEDIPNLPNTNLIKLQKDKIKNIIQFDTYPKLYIYDPDTKIFTEISINSLNGGKPEYTLEYFPEHNDKILIDEVGKYSISKPGKAKLIANLIYQNMYTNNLTITEGMSSVGGDTLALSKKFKKVNAVELDTTRFEYLQHNMKLFNRTNITYYNKSYLDIFKQLKQDVVYLDPPWGGPEYKNLEKVKIQVSNTKLEDLCEEIIKNKLCKLLVLKLPYNYDITEFKKYKLKTYDLRKILIVIIKIN
jgi:16S rRNA G966 N2-methylase RsmD